MAVAQRVYAEALLEASKEKDVLPRVREDFDAFAAALGESDELRGFLRNPQVETETKIAALDDLLAGGQALFRNFLHLLAEKGRLGEVDDVHTEFGRLLAREERVLELELTTAVELSDKEAAKVVKQIEEASGRSVVATRTVDPDIIGGIVVQAGSMRADASVRGRLDQLREELINR
ncbi:MAG TPA: ATP synthase F1 subunit delta [Gaiellaceae bacterium]|nr:ATP synthase F1 subunit delta [Gaiellaceae bacterium]